MENFDDAVNSRDRRETLGQSIERSGYSGVSGLPVLDIHTNGKDVHPVDVITKVMEGEGMKILLGSLKKAELKVLCEHSGVTADVNSKRDMVKAITTAWIDVGTKKFLKKKVNDTTLSLFCKSLNLPSPTSRSSSIEHIIRQINIIGLETFSKRIQDDSIKLVLEQTSKESSKSPLRKNGELKISSRMPTTSPTSKDVSLSSKELAKSQELQKKSKTNGGNKTLEKEKSPRRTNGEKRKKS